MQSLESLLSVDAFVAKLQAATANKASNNRSRSQFIWQRQQQQQRQRHQQDQDQDDGVIDSSSDESDVLEAFEHEVRDEQFMSKAHVAAFDKMKPRKRYCPNPKRSAINEPVDPELDERVVSILQKHLRRKRLRRKVRNAPEEIMTMLPASAEDVASEDAPFLKREFFEKGVITEPKDFASSPGSPAATATPKVPPRLSQEQLTAQRHKLWTTMVKREMTKGSKARNYNARERAANCRRVAQACMRAVRQRAVVSQRNAKDTVWRAKRLTREMQAYWKRFDRVVSQQKRQQEKEAEEQQRIDHQLLEAKRQQRKLNFLITQTELYAHFMAKKVVDNTDTDVKSKAETAILDNLEEDPNLMPKRLAAIDTFDADAAKSAALTKATQALDAHEKRTQAYDVAGSTTQKDIGRSSGAEDVPQPGIFDGQLKNYQLKGMNWMLNLYDQGINGILADEMGLGKTVQTLALLAYIAEKYNIWGPFLVITPASTLHNWVQEVARFVPAFKVVPYWGSPQERKILRHFWDQKNLHTRHASFHVVITSYQLVIADFKFFQRLQWQYLVLDEAQAIKSSSSQRWKLLLEFRCRNRLLLSGTPIQNSMAELWALLHFVMPTLFDSHDEFNDWFSKDIESSAESKGQVDQKQISRLHMILKPFMLRRIKKDVENELTDKLEVLMYCPLTIRQKLLYMALKRKIKIDDLLKGLGSQKDASGSVTSSLMNLVMQFRKVCNHPELFERREARSPFAMQPAPYLIPKLVFHANIHSFHTAASRQHLLYNKFFVFHPDNVNSSLKQTRSSLSSETLEVSESAFSYLRFVDTSASEQHALVISLLEKWLLLARELHRRRTLQRAQAELSHRKLFIYRNKTPSWLSFTSPTEPLLGHADVKIHSMQETISHRLLRTRKARTRKRRFDDVQDDDLMQNLIEEIPYVERPAVVVPCQRIYAQPFLYGHTCPRVATSGRQFYAYDRGAAYKLRDHMLCAPVPRGREALFYGSTELAALQMAHARRQFRPVEDEGGVHGSRPCNGWSNIIIPDKQSLVSDSGKLHVLDRLLSRLKEEGHRVLIYSQMTRMIDLLEEYMWHRQHTFMRLDGSSKISARRDMVADFQQRADIFVFLLSTRAGGLGINLTAADTVIFYDSDWNPTVDQQAMDRAHRLGQTKQVTVYRLICKGTIEERILQRAREKSEIQRMVIHGGSFKAASSGTGGGELKPKEVVSLLLDDDEIERKYKAKKEQQEQAAAVKRELPLEAANNAAKKPRLNLHSSDNNQHVMSNGNANNVSGQLFDFMGEKLGPKRLRARGTGGKRGRPRGVKKNPGGPGRDVLAPFNNGIVNMTIKRGPGRPRTRPAGQSLNQGGRGPPPRQAKPAKLKNKGLPAALAATLNAKYGQNFAGMAGDSGSSSN